MRTLFAALLVLTACSIQSCKQGCKDKGALNFNSKASSEDGTCLYCKSSFSADTATYFFSRFGDSSSGNNGNTAIEFILVADHASVSGNGCRSIGKQQTDSCNNYLTIINLTNLNAQSSFFEAQFIQGSSEWVFVSSQFTALGPRHSGHDTLSLGLVNSNTCSDLTSGILDFNINEFQFF